jgi:hypothetical protein
LQELPHSAANLLQPFSCNARGVGALAGLRFDKE